MTCGTVEGGHIALYGVKRFASVYLVGVAGYEHFYSEADRSIDWVVNESARASSPAMAFMPP